MLWGRWKPKGRDLIGPPFFKIFFIFLRDLDLKVFPGEKPPAPFSSSSLPPIPFHRGGRWKLQKGPK